MTTFFDTCALSAMLNSKEPHHAWCLAQFNASRVQGPIVIPDIVYCELSVTMPSVADVDALVRRLALSRLPHTNSALFAAGKAFLAYRKANRGQAKTGVLPDYLIGALANDKGAPLVTTNPRDFKKHFPQLKIIKP